MFKDCYGWEDYYQISKAGEIRSKNRIGTNGRVFSGRKINPIKSSSGYLVVNLTGGKRRKQELLHRLVLFTFSGAPLDGMQACHNDGDRQNPALDNLRWDTVKNNHADKISHGTSQANEKNGGCKFSNKIILEIRESKLRKHQIIKKYKISSSHLKRVLNMQTRNL